MRFYRRNLLTDTAYLLLLLTLLVSSGCGGVSRSLDRKADKKIYDDLIAIQKKFRKLRADEATPEQWKLFSVKVRAETIPMLEDLHKRAKTTSPATQQLLFAARDYLPVMLVNARETPDENEEQFDECLEFVRKHFAGEPLVND